MTMVPSPGDAPEDNPQTVKPNATAIRALVDAYRRSHSHMNGFTCCSAHAAADTVPTLLALVERQAKRIAELEGRAPTPQPPVRRPVDPNSRAARLAWLIAEKFPKDAMTELVDGDTLTVYVTPAALGDWDWWLGRFHVEVGTTTHRGSYTTAKGNHGSVKVLLTGHGVPALYAAERAQSGGAL